MHNKRKQKLMERRFALGLIRREDCTAEENVEYIKLYNLSADLPEGVYKYEDQPAFYRAVETFSAEERMEYIALEQARLVRTIKNCAIFFVVLTAIGLVLSLSLL